MNRPKITVALAIIGNEFEPCIQNLNSLPSASSIELLIMDGNDDGAVETFLKKHQWNFYQYDILYERNCLKKEHTGNWPTIYNYLLEHSSGEYIAWWSDELSCNQDVFANALEILNEDVDLDGIVFYEDLDSKFGLFKSSLRFPTKNSINHPREAVLNNINIAKHKMKINHLKKKSNMRYLDQSINKLYILYDNKVSEYSIPEELRKAKSRKTAGIKFSIMIPSLIKRNGTLNKLINDLQKQLKNYSDKIEILVFVDSKKYKVGYKRNILLECAHGQYTAFVDDDDELAKNYIFSIMNVIDEGADCLGFVGQITTNGKNPRKFIHSIEHKKIYSIKKRGKIEYYRPPNHLNPMKASIAKKFKFLDINFQEDLDWCLQIQRSGLLKTQVMLPGILYYYKYSDTVTETQK